MPEQEPQEVNTDLGWRSSTTQRKFHYFTRDGASSRIRQRSLCGKWALLDLEIDKMDKDHGGPNSDCCASCSRRYIKTYGAHDRGETQA